MVYKIIPSLGTQALYEPETRGHYYYYLINLNDGYNSPERLYHHAKQILSLMYHRRIPIILVCQAGISRSNGMASLVLAFDLNISLDEAYEIVKKKVPRAQVNYDFYDCCKQTLVLMRKRLVSKCRRCGAPVEFWEEHCKECYLDLEHLRKLKEGMDNEKGKRT